LKKSVKQNKKINVVSLCITYIRNSMNKGDVSLPGIRETLTRREHKSKVHFIAIVSLLVLAIILKSLFDYSTSPAQAQYATDTRVNLAEYIQEVSNSSYYLWKGNVTISGTVSSSNLQSASLVGYINNSLTPIFSLPKSGLNLSGGQYSFDAVFDSRKHANGYHTIRIYDGQVTSIPSLNKQPLYEFAIYIDNDIKGKALSTSNLRSAPDHTKPDNIIGQIPTGAEVLILGEIKGSSGTVTIDGKTITTDVWYNVIYRNSSGTVFEGYVFSGLISIFSNSIISMKVKAPGAVIEEFASNKFVYDLNLPFSSSYLEISDIVRAFKSDQLAIKVNGVTINPPYSKLNLKTGDNKIEIIYQAATNSPASNRTYIYNIWRISESVEAEFQAQLAKFPESYKQSLLALHSKYPNWVFVAHNLDWEWNYVIDNQHKGTNSLIWSPPHDLKPIEYVDSYVIVDGSSFVKASKAAIEYYVDPRNFFTESRIFQFEQLSYNPAVHKLEGLQRMFANSGHAGKENMFLQAGKDSNVSPYHLASRSRLELGNPLSVIATGKYNKWDGKYLGLYNFYNIGTAGSITDPDILIRNGLEFALGNYPDGKPRPFTPERFIEYMFPWDTEQKAITGGARYIGNNYINRGQDTLYYQKFNPIAPGMHQYMQNIEAPIHESSRVFTAYRNSNALSTNILFKIPVYKNMPELPTPRPDDTNKLNFLSVKDTTMSPVFNPDINGLYTVSVPYNTEKITINATTLNSKATITGRGEKNIVPGDNDFTVTVTPSNGLKRDYKIRVTRMPPDESNDNALKSLSVEGFELSKVFNPEDTGPYVVYVPMETQKATVSALASSVLSSIVGDGEKTLNPGLNDYSVTVTAQDGSKRIYRIQIIRISEEEKSEASLKSLSVENVDISPGFSEGNTGVYKATVPSTLSKVKISAQSNSQFSSVIGAGEKNLAFGKNNFAIRVTAMDGTQKTYTIEITRERPVVPTGNYVFSSNIVSGINLSTTVKEMKESLKTPHITYKFLDNSKKELTDNQIIGTGITVEILIDGKKEKEYKTVVFGDLNGDGKVNILDFLILRSHILGIKELSGEMLIAADINKDNRINVLDLLMTRSHILGIVEIKQR